MSSNVLFPEFWAQEILLQLYSKSAMIPLVHKDFSPQIASQGEIVHVVRPDVATVQAVNPSSPVTETATPTGVSVTLANWIQTKPKAITDKLLSMSYVDLVSLYMEPMGQAIVKYIEQDLIAQTATFSNHITGIPSTVAGFAGLKKEFDVQLVPDGNRNVVMNPDGEVAYQGLYGAYNISGDQGVATQTTGKLGTKHGMDFYGSTLVNAVDSNLAAACFHRNAVCLVSRAPQAVPFAPTGTQAIVNYKGLGLRVSFTYVGLSKTTYVDCDILYGTAMLDDRLGFRLNVA